MRRKDMEPGVLYAISVNSQCRPGLVLDAGQPPNKCRVKRYWKWPGDDENDGYLNPTPDITSELAKADISMVETNAVIDLWSEHCERVLSERQAMIAKRQAEDAEREAERMARLHRTTVVLGKLEERGYSDVNGLYVNLQWAAKNHQMGRWTSSEFSARDIVDLLEFLLLDTPVSQSTNIDPGQDLS